MNRKGSQRIFINRSVDTGDIDDGLSAETIRETIRDEYLRDSTVTIVLVGSKTKRRKHIDWEIYSSMFDGKVNTRSGILAITLPTSGGSNHFTAAHGKKEKEVVHPSCTNWTSIDSRVKYEERYPSMPDRIVDQLVADDAKVSVTPWSKLNREKLSFLITKTHENRESCEYDLSRSLRRQNG